MMIATTYPIMGPSTEIRLVYSQIEAVTGELIKWRKYAITTGTHAIAIDRQPTAQAQS